VAVTKRACAPFEEVTFVLGAAVYRPRSTLALRAGTASLLAVCAVAGTAAGPARAWGTASGGPGFASVEAARVHPGVLLIADHKGCTANFVFTDAAGTYYLGEAAHCTSRGEIDEFNGCTDDVLPLGTRVDVDGAEVSGKLAYSSWGAMQAAGEKDKETCLNNDFALIRLPAAATAQLNPSVPHFGGPTGLDTDGSRPGDLVYSYGNSPTRFGIAALSPKYGVVADQIEDGWTHLTYFVTPVIPGDSGSGVLDAQGRAQGVASSLILFPSTGANGVADLAMALEYARAHSGIRGLRLVEGTAPFVVSAAG
jgi:hypothetical protein